MKCGNGKLVIFKTFISFYRHLTTNFFHELFSSPNLFSLKTAMGRRGGFEFVPLFFTCDYSDLMI